jgi:type IV secretory pathway TraG/TraD family ATPase VirD4
MNGKTRNRPAAPGQGNIYLVGAAVGAVLVLYGWTELTSFLRTGNWVPGFPPTVATGEILGVVQGRIPWTGEHLTAAVLVGTLTILVLGLALYLWKRKPKLTDAGKAARHLGKGEELSLESVTKRSDASRLTTGDVKGVMLVRTMTGKKDRYTDFRKTGTIIMGPESGKTTGFAIPMIMNAPGVVFATTNKRDLPDAIRGARPGKRWVFDPQRITGKNTPDWWLNLNDYVTDEVRATKLAKIWMDASGPTDAKRDAYFDSAGPNLLAGLLLACSISDQPISQVFRWLTNSRDKRPIKILEEAGYVLPAAALEGVYFAPDEQRAGVFGTASEMVSFLNNSRVREWLEPRDILDKRPCFSPEQFVRSERDTMIALSKEGIGSTGPLTAALTIWVLDAAEEFADENPHGRLPIPLMAILDEVANVCRLKDLPDLYSHYGSRGICPWAILQNWSQGCRVWSRDGMQQMWDASNIRIVGSGQADPTFLKSISDLVGRHYVTEYSTSSSKGKNGYSRSSSQRLESVLEPDDIAAFELGECLVHFSGGRPFLANTVPWFKRPEMEPLVAASIEEFEPA